MANEPRNMYANTDFFRILVMGQWYYIEEPFNWDKIGIRLDRDEVFIGFNYEFVDDEIKLIFKEGAGMEQLRTLYQLQGSDAYSIFEYGYKIKGVKHVQFSGTINFNTYHIDEDGVEISVEKIQFENLLRTRWDTKVDFSATVDFDGRPIVPPTPIRIKMHSKQIVKSSKAEADPAGLPTQQTLEDNAVWILPDTSNITKDEISEMYSMLVGVVAQDSNPAVNNMNQFTSIEQGRLKWSWTASFVIDIIPAGIFTKIGDWYLQPMITVRRSGTSIVHMEPVGLRRSGTSNSNFFQLPVAFTINGTFDLLAGDEVYFYCLLWTQNNAQRFWKISNYQGSIEMMQQTSAPASICSGYKIFDVLNHIVHFLTGVPDAVSSLFHGAGGAAEKYLLTNGYQVRNFDITNKPVKLTMKEVADALNIIFFDGIQYSKELDTGKTLVRVEHAPEFFKGKPITHIQEVYDYEEDHADNVTYNELEIGYQKLPEEDLNSLDEFNTYQSWLLPITTYKKKYVKRTNAIGSGYMIEALRREQFKDSPSTSLTGDDDMVIIAYITERIYKDTQIDIGGEFARFGTPMNLQVGEQFRIFRSGSPNPGTVFTVQAIDFSAPEKYKITPNAVAENGIGQVEILIDMPQAERNEPFEVVENLISPETAYNLRITPKRITLNHSQWIECCLPLKSDDQQLINTFQKNNGALITRFRPSELNKLTAENYTLREDANIPLAEFNGRQRLFLPVLATFKAGVPYNIFVAIRDGLMHQSGTDHDGGTITFREPKTELNWEAVVNSVMYEPRSGIATFKVWKKKII